MAGETVTAATIIDAPAEAIFGSSRPGQARRDRRHRLGLRMTRRRSRTSSANTPDSPVPSRSSGRFPGLSRRAGRCVTSPHARPARRRASQDKPVARDHAPWMAHERLDVR